MNIRLSDSYIKLPVSNIPCERIWLTLLLVFVHIPTSFSASDNELEMLLSLDLEALLELKISVASTKTETITNTPAIVSTYRMDELAQQGVHTLEEALSIIPGIVIDEGSFGNTTVMIRGVTDAFGSKVLFLLDGIPYWSPSHNSIPTLGIPTEAIERIEVIRGPGAVIYGTNAISGVINVITKSQQDGSASVSIGNDDHLKIGALWTTNLSNESWVALSFEHQSQDGYLGEYRFGDVGVVLPKQKEVSSAMVRYGNGDLNLLFHAFEDTVQGRSLPTTVNSTPLNDVPLFVSSEGYLLHGDYTWKSAQSTITTYTDYNKYSISFVDEIDTVRFDDDGENNYRWRIGLQYIQNFESLEGLSLLMGAEYENRSIDSYRSYSSDDLSMPNFTAIESDSTHETSAYLQLDYSTDDWRFLTGARWTDNEKAGSKVTPRMGAIYNLADNQSLKLLYAVGFTSPNFVHTSFNIPGALVGNSSIEAETIATVDFAYTYTSPTMIFVINAYTFDGEDFITRVPNPAPGTSGTTYVNAEKFSRKGLEIDFKKKVGDWSIVANASFNAEGNQSILDDFGAISVPKTVFNLGGTYQFYDNHTWGATIQSVSRRSTTDSYLVVNLNYGYHYGKIETFITLRNITGEDPHNPDATTGFPTLSLPKGDEDMNILAGIKFNF